MVSTLSMYYACINTDNGYLLFALLLSMPLTSNENIEKQRVLPANEWQKHRYISNAGTGFLSQSYSNAKAFGTVGRSHQNLYSHLVF